MNFRTLSFLGTTAIAFGATAQLPEMDIALFDIGNNTLEVRARPSMDFDGVFSAIVFTIQWEAGSGAVLGNETQVSPVADFLPISTSGPYSDDGNYRYQPYVGFGFSTLASEGAFWTAGNEYVLCTIPVLNGSSLFQIVNDTWTGGNNADFFVSLNGSNQTGIIYGNPSLVVEGASSTGTTLHLQPNPATTSTQLTLSSQQTTNVEVKLCDAAGRVVWQRNYGALNGTRQETIDVRGFDAGTYLLHVVGIDGSEVQRLVIQ